MEPIMSESIVMVRSGTILEGQPVCQVSATPGSVVVSDGSTQVAGIATGTTTGTNCDVQMTGIVETNRADLVVGTTYYAIAEGKYTSTAGAVTQRVGIAVSNSAISMDLEHL
jgi:hypothetical protein